MFVCVRKKVIIIAILVVVAMVGIFGTFFAVREVGYSPKTKYTVVIDAGHGGLDVNKRL